MKKGTDIMKDENAARQAIAEEFKWQPSHIYENEERWEEDFHFIQLNIEKLAGYAGTIQNGKETVLSYLRLSTETEEHFNRLFTYVMCCLNADNSNSYYQALMARCQSLATQYEFACAFFSPEMLALPEETLTSYCEDTDFADWDEALRLLAQERPHVLDAATEKLLANASEALCASSNIYDMLTDVDMKLGKVKNEEGKTVELTHALYSSLLESKNRSVRKGAWERMLKAYQGFGSTFAATYSANVKKDVFSAKTRHFSSARAASLFPDDVPETVYDNLITAVHDAIPVLNEYCRMRERALNIPKAHMYDLYVPMTKNFNVKLSFDEAYELLLEAVAPLGNDYQEAVRSARHEGWIDVYETPNKTTGAYSNGAAYGVHPYVLLNFRPELEGLMTLAHEMGHAMHSYYSNHNQPFAKHDYTIFVAEVASTCNEILTIHALRKKYEGNMAAQATLIGRLLEGFRTTVFRQTLFAEFEMKAHAMEESGEPLTRETLSRVYYELNKTYYGGGCVVDKIIENEWMRIPHFYRPFYVYKYATGFCAAMTLAQHILHDGEEGVAAYRKFLTLGGSMPPIEELKVAGVDMSSPEPIYAALDTFAELLAEFSELIRE